MTKIISARGDDNEVSMLPELLSTSSVKSLFWKPKFLHDDTVAQYLPLMFWLVDAMRPRNVLHLGVGLGTAYLGLCQAIDKLDLGAQCHGYGPFVTPGATPDKPGPAIPRALLRTCETHFDGIAILSAAPQAAAADRFADASVDLLVAEMSDDADLITSLTRDLPDRMGKSGVMVLHGTHRHADQPQVQALLGRLRNLGRTVEFDWGDGAMMVLVGPEPATRVARLVEQMHGGSSARQTATTVLRRLGTAHWLNARVDALTAREDSGRRAETAARKEAEALRARLDQVTSAYDLRSAKVAELQVHLFDSQQARMAATAAEAEARGALTALEQQATALQKSLAEALAADTVSAAEAQAQVAALQSALDTARADLDRTTATLAANDAAHAHALQSLTQARDEATALLAAKSDEAGTLANRLTDLEATLTTARAEADAALDAKSDEADALASRVIDLQAALDRAALDAEAILAAKSDEAGDLAARLADLEATLTAARAEAEAALDAKSDEADALASRVIDLQAALDRAVMDADAALAAQTDAADAQLSSLNSALQAAQDSTRDQMEAARHALERRDHELAALVSQIEAAAFAADATLAAKTEEARGLSSQLLTLRAEDHLGALQSTHDALVGRLTLAQKALEQRTEELARLTAQSDETARAAEAALAAKSTEAEQLGADLAAQTAARAQAMVQIATLTQTIAEAERQIDLRFHEIAQLTLALEQQDTARHQLGAKLKQAEQMLVVRGQEVAIAQNRIAVLEADMKDASRSADELATFINQQDTEIQRVRRDAARLEKQLMAVHRSRSWRMLAPLRALTRLATGRKRPGVFVPTYLDATQPDRRGRMARIMPALRREFTSPGSLSQEGLVRFLRYQIWGGSAETGVARLEAMLENPATTQIARLRVVSALSTWYDYLGDPARALALLDTLETAPPEIALSKDRLVRKAVILAAMGKVDAARAAIDLLPEPVIQYTDVMLIRANLAPNIGARMTRLNRVFERRGFAPLRLIDKSKPLTMHNISTVDIESHIPDQGLVSVIMPAYNSSATIEMALGSVLRQSYRNLEVLVVDDCSTDDTAAIVTRLSLTDPRLRLIRQDTNAGAYPARNRGLAEAKGVFLTTHDADDWSHPQKIEEQLRALAETPKTMAAITHWARVRPTMEFTTNWRLSAEVVHWSHSSLLFRREIFDTHGGWDNVRVSADTEFIWRIEAIYGKRSVKKLHKDVPFAFALDDDTSLTRTKLTHVSTSYYGLRHYYREISRYFLSQYPKGLTPEAKAAKAAIVPVEMHSRDETPVVIDLWLKGDFTRDAVVQKMRATMAAHPGKAFGVTHVIDPLFERDMPSYAAIFCNAFFETLLAQKPRIVLPGVTVTAGQVIDLNSRT